MHELFRQATEEAFYENYLTTLVEIHVRDDEWLEDPNTKFIKGV